MIILNHVTQQHTAIAIRTIQKDEYYLLLLFILRDQKSNKKVDLFTTSNWGHSQQFSHYHHPKS